MTFSFSFATLANTRVARLNRKDILTKIIYKKNITKKINVFKNPSYCKRTSPLFKVPDVHKNQ